MKLLNGHDSAETAHVTFDYPFGRSVRCVRREYIEVGSRGASKGKYRFVTQTTHKRFNLLYTDKIAELGIEQANAWAQQMIAAGSVLWNAPKASTYSALMVMVEAPLDDGSGRIGVSHIGLSVYAGPTRVQDFKDATRDQLTPAQAARLSVLEQVGRKLDHASWAAYDAKATA